MRRLVDFLARRCSRPWRFSLAAALIVVTAFCVGMGIYVNRPRPMVAGSINLGIAYKKQYSPEVSSRGRDDAYTALANFLMSDRFLSEVLRDGRVKTLKWVREEQPSAEQLRRRCRIRRYGSRMSLVVAGGPTEDMAVIVDVALEQLLDQPNPYSTWYCHSCREADLKMAEQLKQETVASLERDAFQLKNTLATYQTISEHKALPILGLAFETRQELLHVERSIRKVQSTNVRHWTTGLRCGLRDRYDTQSPCAPAEIVTLDQVHRLGADVTPL